MILQKKLFRLSKFSNFVSEEMKEVTLKYDNWTHDEYLSYHGIDVDTLSKSDWDYYLDRPISFVRDFKIKKIGI